MFNFNIRVNKKRHIEYTLQKVSVKIKHLRKSEKQILQKRHGVLQKNGVLQPEKSCSPESYSIKDSSLRIFWNYTELLSYL